VRTHARYRLQLRVGCDTFVFGTRLCPACGTIASPRAAENGSWPNGCPECHEPTDHDGLLLFPEEVHDRQANGALLSPAGWRSLEYWARQRAGRPASQRAGADARALALEETTAYLLALADFEMTHAGALALTGPHGQEAGIAALGDDFLMVLRAGDAPAAAITWSEDCAGLRRFLEVILSRLTAGQAEEGEGLDVAGWECLERLAGQRARPLAGRRISAETRALRTDEARHGAAPPHRGDAP